VLFHPVGSKVSSHALDAHIHVGDLCLGKRRRKHGPEQNQHAYFFDIQDIPPLEMNSKLLGNAETHVTTDRRIECSAGMRNVPIRCRPDMHARLQTNVGCDASQ
jgi:hypothetical protein